MEEKGTATGGERDGNWENENKQRRGWQLGETRPMGIGREGDVHCKMTVQLGTCL